MPSLDPRLLYPDAHFFLDFIHDRHRMDDLFQHSLHTVHRLAELRTALPASTTRAEVADALLAYNRELGASDRALRNADLLRDADTYCVIGGQQAGFLGGPLFVIFKIASILCTAAHLSERIAAPVVPLFWLATEDHDLDEINRTRWIDGSGALRTLSFDWQGKGQPIEQLPITPEVQHAYRQALEQIPFANPSHADAFAPADGDSYATWHARIWSRLFADHGLVLVEPRILRPLSQDLFGRALADRNALQQDLVRSAAQMESLGYTPPLDTNRAGILFSLSHNGGRQRVDQIDVPTSRLLAGELSPDAALRPIFADSLLPTIASILGPSELAYHALLRHVYERWGIPQPIPLARCGGTIIARHDAQALVDLDAEVADVMRPEFSLTDLLSRRASQGLNASFTAADVRLEEALVPLKEQLLALDPGLEARWQQTLDQCRHQLQRLKDRAVRAQLARRGISSRSLQRLADFLLPTGKPQERIISAFSMVASFGVEWIQELLSCEEPDRFIHHLIELEASHD